MPELPVDQSDFEASLKAMLDKAMPPPSAEASLPVHLMHLQKQFTDEGFSAGQALYLVMAIVTQNPGQPPTI